MFRVRKAPSRSGQEACACLWTHVARASRKTGFTQSPQFDRFTGTHTHTAYTNVNHSRAVGGPTGVLLGDITTARNGRKVVCEGQLGSARVVSGAARRGAAFQTKQQPPGDKNCNCFKATLYFFPPRYTLFVKKKNFPVI